jgi:glyoxylase-like metal-dependent hydrolase (beta-lactamase superfamily II)
MKKYFTLTLVIFLMIFFPCCKKKNDHYQVFAVKYLESKTTSAKNVAIGANPVDSVNNCFMVWLLKGDDGRTILIDAGYTDTTIIRNQKYVRPDLVLQRMNVFPDDITDLILTHPHWDHIGGITLFPKATIWMQRADFDYYVSGKWQEDGHSRGFTKDNIPDILNVQAQGRLKLVEGDSLEIIPGIRVFTGSRHSWENQYLLINSNSKNDKILLASDASWFYYNLDHLVSVPLVIDPESYVKALRRMKTLVPDSGMIIPGHDDLVFSKFPKVAEWIVRIEK